jgi:hypothetical protein
VVAISERFSPRSLQVDCAMFDAAKALLFPALLLALIGER